MPRMKSARVVWIITALRCLTGLMMLCPVAVAASPEGMARQVTIYRDRYGTPHVFGRTDASTVFGFAYAQAEDNFPRMEENFILALGRGSEIYGEALLSEDRLNRTLEVERRAREDFKQGTPKIREICQAFADGANYYLARHPEVKPRLLAKIEPWYPLAFIRYNYYQNGFARDSKLQLPRTLAGTLDIDDHDRNGSNGWVIAPSRSAAGHAMLLINPHLPFFGSGQIYEGHLHSDQGWEFTGYARFGFPLPYIGHNSRLGWMSTDNSADMVDAFVEQFDDPKNPLAYKYGNDHRTALERTEIIRVKTAGGLEERPFRFLATHHGPVVKAADGRIIALRMAKYESHGWLDEWYRMTRASSVKELKTAIAPLDMLFGNIMAADAGGNIFYVYNASVPKRDPHYDWSKPVDGSDPGVEWRGYYSLADLPQLENPPTGWMQNCNTSPFLLTSSGNPDPSRYPQYMVREGDNPRGRASMRILNANSKFTFEQWSRAAFDTHVITADELLPNWLAETSSTSKDGSRDDLIQVLAELRQWNHDAAVDSVATTLFINWHHAMERKEPTRENLLSTLQGVVAQLVAQHGTWKVPYGEIARLQRSSREGQPPFGRPAFDDGAPSLPVPGVSSFDGAIFTVNAVPFLMKDEKRRYGVQGATYVSVVEFGAPARALSVVTFGSSGDPHSPHFFDQAQLYAKGQFKPSWFTRDEVERNAAVSYHPGEERPAKD